MNGTTEDLMDVGMNVRQRKIGRTRQPAAPPATDGVARRPVPTCEFGYGGLMGLYTYNLWCPGQLDRATRLPDGFRTNN